MKTAVRSLTLFFAFVAVVFLLVAPAYADTESEIAQLRESLAAQKQQIEAQQKMLAAQQEKLASQEALLQQHMAKLDSLGKLSDDQMKAASGAGESKPVAGTTAPSSASAPVEAVSSGTSITAPEATEPKKRPEIAILPDAGGILTPKGSLMYENSVEYTNTTSNVFSFNGVEVAQVVLVGTLNANSARRQVIQDTSRFRMGVTNRLEADVRVPYVYRNDRTSSTAVSTGASSTTNVDGSGLGDIDTGLAYQFNAGRGGWPFFVGNLRYKANNGEGPYDVPYDSNNSATRLPVGSGFNSVEGSLTVIKVSDPTVLFTNVGYVHNIGESIDKNFNTTHILDVDPGDVINASAGMGFSVNRDVSFTLGYKHSVILPTIQHAMDIGSGALSKSKTDTLQVGSLLMGLSYRVAPFTNINFNAEVGATRDAPDVHLTLRIPFKLAQFF